MRGRVDASAGYPVRQSTPPMMTNLIQKFQHGLALSRIFNVKERTPSPVMGQEVMPVVITDDILRSPYPPRPLVYAGAAVGGLGVNFHWVTLNCRGNLPVGDVQDRLVCHRILVGAPSTIAAIVELWVGLSSGITGLNSDFALYQDTGIDQPQIGARRSDYTSFSFGESADAVPAGQPAQLFVPNGQTLEVPGPFVIGQGECIALRYTNITANPKMVMFFAEEWPRA